MKWTKLLICVLYLRTTLQIVEAFPNKQAAGAFLHQHNPTNFGVICESDAAWNQAYADGLIPMIRPKGGLVYVNKQHAFATR